MKCKPGDMALIIAGNGHSAANIGKMVTCIQLGEVLGYKRGPVWVIDRPMAWNLGSERILLLRLPDSDLMPIPPLGDTDDAPIHQPIEGEVEHG